MSFSIYLCLTLLYLSIGPCSVVVQSIQINKKSFMEDILNLYRVKWVSTVVESAIKDNFLCEMDSWVHETP